MKNFLLTCSLFIISNCFAQWTTLDIPDGGRYDDVFFTDSLRGWAAGGNSTKIYHTSDGGTTWGLQDSTGKYLRSIEFLSPLTGFCGSLDSSLFKTTDGGKTWIDISTSIQPRPKGVCGLSAPSPQVIYGCGIWSSPAYVIKSSDGGNTWSTINMSAYASTLVDIHFISPDTGFVTGRSINNAEGGIILYTTNGGASWQVLYKTMIAHEMIWKLQSPDGTNYYGAIQPGPTTRGVRMLHSYDKGLTWDTVHVSDSGAYIQTVGFLNPQKGWLGGYELFETGDAGLTWKKIKVGGAYNRFFKMNEKTAFLTGSRVYRYGPGASVGMGDYELHDDLHQMNVSPNPASHGIEINVNAANKTHAQIRLYSAKGELLNVIHDNQLSKGSHRFSVGVSDYSPQILTVLMHTNEGVIVKKIVKK